MQDDILYIRSLKGLNLEPLEVINSKKEHLARLANQTGAAGEAFLVSSMNDLIPRPKGQQLKNLLAALENVDIKIKHSSFDAISLPDGKEVDLNNPESINSVIDELIFVEIKTANQDRVKESFTGFFFALTESEISASEALGNRHKVIFFNKITGNTLVTSIPEIINRAKSTNWQMSVQL